MTKKPLFGYHVILVTVPLIKRIAGQKLLKIVPCKGSVGKFVFPFQLIKIPDSTKKKERNSGDIGKIHKTKNFCCLIFSIVKHLKQENKFN